MFGRLFESPIHLLILVLVVVVLFGAKRLPDAARGLGRSLRILKSEVKELKDEAKREATADDEPLQGRVVQPNTGSSSATGSDQRHDA